MNEEQVATVEAVALRRGCPGDWIVLEDRADFADVVVGQRKGRPKLLVVSAAGVLTRYETLTR